MIPAEARFTGVMDSREAIIVAGLPVAEAFFRVLDPEVAIERLAREGHAADAGADLLHLAGKARALLTEAFLVEVVDRIEHDGAREVVREWLTARL